MRANCWSVGLHAITLDGVTKTLPNVSPGSRGDHMTRMTSGLLECLFDSDVMELLLLMAQRTAQVCPTVLDSN